MSKTVRWQCCQPGPRKEELAHPSSSYMSQQQVEYIYIYGILGGYHGSGQDGVGLGGYIRNH